MKTRLTQSSISALKVKDKSYWVTDDGFDNLRLYVGTRGKTWYVDYRDENGKKAHRKLGSADALTVTQAREMARDVAARVARGESVKKEKPAEKLTLGAFLNDIYYPAIRRTHKSHDKTIRGINVTFSSFFPKPIETLTVWNVEKSRAARLDSGVKAATTNRALAALKAALNWGVKRGLIEKNPLQRLEKAPEADSKKIVRYLSPDERERLESALIAREERLCRENRHAKGEFADYLRPAVLLSLNTGIRRGTLFSLLWGDVDFASQTLTLRGEVSKNGKTARIPINDDAADILSSWYGQSQNAAPDDLIFPSPRTGGQIQEIKNAWKRILLAAEITDFRWHDLRHSFASELVMRGVDLNTVRELLGHSDMKMTMRYAHLAPEYKLNAVQILNRRTKENKIIPLRKIAGNGA